MSSTVITVHRTSVVSSNGDAVIAYGFLVLFAFVAVIIAIVRRRGGGGGETTSRAAPLDMFGVTYTDGGLNSVGAGGGEPMFQAAPPDVTSAPDLGGYSVGGSWGGGDSSFGGGGAGGDW